MKKRVLTVILLALAFIVGEKANAATFVDDTSYPKYSYEAMENFMAGYRYYYTGETEKKGNSSSRVIAAGYYDKGGSKHYDQMSGQVPNRYRTPQFTTGTSSGLDQTKTTLHFRYFFENSAHGYSPQEIFRNSELSRIYIDVDPAPASTAYYPDNKIKVTFFDDSGHAKSTVIPTDGELVQRPGPEYVHMMIEGAYTTYWKDLTFTGMALNLTTAREKITIPGRMTMHNGRNDIVETPSEPDIFEAKIKDSIYLGEMKLGDAPKTIQSYGLLKVKSTKNDWQVTVRDKNYNPSIGAIGLSINRTPMKYINDSEQVFYSAGKAKSETLLDGTFTYNQGLNAKAGAFTKPLEWIFTQKVN